MSGSGGGAIGVTPARQLGGTGEPPGDGAPGAGERGAGLERRPPGGRLPSGVKPRPSGPGGSAWRGRGAPRAPPGAPEARLSRGGPKQPPRPLAHVAAASRPLAALWRPHRFGRATRQGERRPPQAPGGPLSRPAHPGARPGAHGARGGVGRPRQERSALVPSSPSAGVGQRAAAPGGRPTTGLARSPLGPS